MTKEEEIREGIDRDIEFVLMAAYYAGKTRESISETIDKCKLHLKESLHSQGVVIRVNKELPKREWYNDWGGESGRNGYELALKDMAGCVAIEPLIKEEK